MECIKNPEKNCCSGGICRDDICPDTHSCCSQKNEKGGNSTLGICVKKDKNGGNGNCDKRLGLPIKSCKDDTNKYALKNSIESFDVLVKEGYNDTDCDCDDNRDCDNWQNAFNILFFIIVLLLITCSVLYIRCRNKN
jgi:hypothetical protein